MSSESSSPAPLDAIESRLRDLRGEARRPAAERAAHLAALESELLAWAAASARAAEAPHASAGDPIVTGAAR